MTVNTNHVAPARPQLNRLGLWQRWVALWSGDLSAGADIVAPAFRLHLPVTWSHGNDSRGRDGLLAWIADFRAGYSDARVSVEAGPVICGELMAARWSFTGLRRDGGGPVRYLATDIVRIEDGHIAECWLSFDTFALFAEASAAG
jgi:hypothetical protein